MKKIITFIILFFGFTFSSYAYTGDLIETKTQTFIELDLSEYDYDLQTYSSGSTLISDYTKEFSDITKLLVQIKYILLITGLFSMLFVFYTLINDLLGKK